MPKIDERLWSLFEALNDVGLFWMSEAIINGLQGAQGEMQSDEVLVVARKRVRDDRASSEDEGPIRDRFISLEGLDDVSDTTGFPLEGDEQLRWAANFIEEELASSLNSMSAAMKSMNAITDPAEPETDFLRDDDAPQPTIVLRDGDVQRTVGLRDVAEAKAGLSALRDALSDWLNEMGQEPGWDHDY